MIHVAYRLWGGDGFFAKMLGTSILSMFENTKEEVTIHVLHNDRLTPDNRGKLCYIAGQYNQHIEFHNVEEIAGTTLRALEAAYPSHAVVNSAWYPLTAPKVFPNLDKIIILGADTIFNIDVSELWNIELNKDFPFGAVAEFEKWGEAYGAKLCYDGLVAHTDYFNADVFLVNPKFFRDNFELILEGCKFAFSHGYALHEQDVLNYLFSKKYQKLPGKFNLVLNWERTKGKKPFRLEKAIYHFAGVNAKPDLDTDDVYNRLYFGYFMKTPWANIDMFGNIGKFMRKLYNNSQDNLLHFTNLLTERKRAFFMDQSYVEAMKVFFRIKDDEKIVTLQEGAEKFTEEITASKGAEIFFILIGKENYRNARMFLLSRGLVEGTDFVDAGTFLSERYILETEFIHISQALVQAL